MSATPTQARDEIVALFKAAWDADEDSCDVPVIWTGVRGEIPDSGSWVRVTVNFDDEGPASISKVHFKTTGTVIIQIFTPHDDGNVQADILQHIAKKAFRGKTTSPGAVWFRRVRPTAVGQDGQWFQTNVLADFEYEEID